MTADAGTRVKRAALYIDTFGGDGHNALNRALISRLSELGFVVYAALRKTRLREIGLPDTVIPVPLPEVFFPDKIGKIRSRYNEFRLLRFIWGKVGSRKFDWLVFSSFDEVSLSFARFRGRALLVAHGNVAGLDNPLKRFFMRFLAKRATLLVFHDYIRDRCAQFGIRDVIVEPQGISAPYPFPASLQVVLGSLDPRLTSGQFEHLVFAPTGAKYNDRLLGDAVCDPAFTGFLESKRIALVIKGQIKPDCRNVIVLPAQLEMSQYQAVFVASTAILLSYPESFAYRTSAALYECFSNHKPCIVSDIMAFRAFEKHFTYQPFFKDITTMTSVIERVCALPSAGGAGPYRHLEILNPILGLLAESQE